MPNAQLEQFIHALEMKAVPPLVLAVFGAALLSLALKWIENRLVRFFRDRKIVKTAEKRKGEVTILRPRPRLGRLGDR